MSPNRSLPALLALLALLVLPGSAQALDAPGSLAPLPAKLLAAPAAEEEEEEAEVSEDEFEAEAEECEVFEDEEICEEVEDGDGSGVEAPPECLLSSAEATVLVSPNRDRVRLQIRYRTTAATAVTISYGLHGAKGTLYLGNEKKRFGKKGVLRLDRDLTEAQMAKVVAAKDFTVRLRPSGAPGWCQPLLERQLDVRRGTPSGFSWQQSE